MTTRRHDPMNMYVPLHNNYVYSSVSAFLGCMYTFFSWTMNVVRKS